MNSTTKLNIPCKIRYINSLKNIIICILVSALFIIMLFYQDSYSKGIKNGIYFCVNTLIPSLFPFMFLSSFIVRSGLSNIMGKILNPITKTLFYLPGCAGTAIFLGLTGGYPTGAKTTNELLNNHLINEEQANRLMGFNVGAGPAFVISVVGSFLLKNKLMGLIIFVSQILFSIFLGILLGIYARIRKKEFYSIPYFYNSNYKYASSLITSCQDAANSTINMCSLIIIFSAFMEILNSIHINNIIAEFLSDIGVQREFAQSIIPVILEVNTGCIAISNSIYSPSLMAFAIGWSGICVHLQIIASFTKESSINIPKFLMFRLIQGLGTSLLVYIITHSFDTTISVYLTQNPPTADKIAFSSSVQGGFALILLCLYFINNLHELLQLNKEKTLNI